MLSDPFIIHATEYTPSPTSARKVIKAVLVAFLRGGHGGCGRTSKGEIKLRHRG